MRRQKREQKKVRKLEKEKKISPWTGLKVTQHKAQEDWKAYQEQERRRQEERPREEALEYKTSKKSGVTFGKVVAGGVFSLVYIIFGTIFELMSNYSKKR